MVSGKKTLFFHIGLGKTGTTALQEFFWSNRKALYNHNIYYPSEAMVSSAHHLASLHVPEFLLYTGWKFLKPFQWTSLINKTRCSRILMSTELMASASQEVVIDFVRSLKALFDLKIVVYVRRQDEIIMSAYSQQAKAGVLKGTIDVLYERQKHRFDYCNMLSMWENEVGLKNIILRPYDAKQFYGQSLIKDFLYNVFAIEDFRGFKFPSGSDVNPRLSADTIEFKKLINNISEDLEFNNRFNNALFSYSEIMTTDGRKPGKEKTLSDKKRREILNFYLLSNSEVAKKYLNREDGKIFSEYCIFGDEEGVTVSNEELQAIASYMLEKFPKDAQDLLSKAREVQNTTERPLINKICKQLISLLSYCSGD